MICAGAADASGQAEIRNPVRYRRWRPTSRAPCLLQPHSYLISSRLGRWAADGAWAGVLETRAVPPSNSDPENRFETAEELLLALERDEASRLSKPRPTPVVERDPLRFWQAVAFVATIFNLLLVYLLLAG